jgi:hypothetical protein
MLGRAVRGLARDHDDEFFVSSGQRAEKGESEGE